MEQLNLNNILNREEQVKEITNILINFEINKQNICLKKGIYIYGNPGTGKTTFVKNILKTLGYDIIVYDAGDMRNASVIDDITNNNMSDKNIMSIFNKKIRKIAIIMDEIDGMNNGDKGGINSLIKLIRPKKTKKQKLEETTINPIICIGNYRVDKKIKELMKVCNTVELKNPTQPQITDIINLLLPNLEESVKKSAINYIKYDLRKINLIYKLYKNNNTFNSSIINKIFHINAYNDDTKKITQSLLHNCYNISDHNNIMNETDRTSVGLLWHENIIDHIDTTDKLAAVSFYIEQLDNICFADYIDRITFQKQIWQFNEMSSLTKTFKNHKLYHANYKNNHTNNNQLRKSKIVSSSSCNSIKSDEIRFTKVLTKYSTEYNNSLFIQKLCQTFGMDKKDLFGFFIDVKNKCESNGTNLMSLFENCDVSKLDINRIYKYIDKYILENASGLTDKEIEFEDDIIEDEFTEMEE